MSRPAGRSLILFGAGIAAGLGSALIWPGDLHNEPMTWAHRVALGGLVLTAALLVLAAVMLFIAVMGAAWKVDDFDVNEYLETMKKNRQRKRS